jgi:sugar-specific transcriptional regulator TrmB
MDETLFKQLGFTDGETRVYLALLELGESTSGNIIKKSKITGSKVYELLEKLIEKGLVSYIIKGQTKYFQAFSPSRIKDYINLKENELNDLKEKSGKLILDLNKVHNKENKTQSSQVFEGIEGIKTFFNIILETLNKNEEYYALSLGDELKEEKVMLFLENYHRKRVEKKIKVKIIGNIDERKPFSILERLDRIEIKYLNNPLPTGVYIFKDYVATVTFKDLPSVFLIKSKNVAESYKKFFLHLWKTAKA